MLKVTECPSCSSKDINIIKSYKFIKSVKESYDDCYVYTERRLWLLFNEVLKKKNTLDVALTHCQLCDLLFTNPRFEDNEIEKKYDALVRIQSTKKEYSTNPILNIDERANRIFELVMSYNPKSLDSSKIKIADIGGQFGNNLKYFSSENYEKCVIDYEEYNLYDDIKYLLPDEPVGVKKFDVMLTNHTVEHMNFPENNLRKYIDQLRDGGLLYIEVPLGAFREAYNVKEPLTHFNFYSEFSMCHLLKNLGVQPLLVDSKYQWVTDHAEWCVNAIGVKLSSNNEATMIDSVKNACDIKNNIALYYPLIMKKLLRNPEFGL